MYILPTINIKQIAAAEESTPFFFYDLNLLKSTLERAAESSGKYGFEVHYALKANSNPEILRAISTVIKGADCVSGNEVLAALQHGFKPEKIAFAGVGKTDMEIDIALENNIFSLNVESVQELEVINQRAGLAGKKAPVALRLNPGVNAKTHHYITTGLEENKFGINPWELEKVLEVLKKLRNIELTGIHFHIGSQITNQDPFRSLALRANEFNHWFRKKGIYLKHINLGGGLGVNYQQPDTESIPDFESFFRLFADVLELLPGQTVHFELGRALVAQCGTLVSKVLYVKSGINTNFVILDAGMTELIRPALYQAYHKIENISHPEAPTITCDVVGPICESSDCFGKAILLPQPERGHFIAIRTTGAYGEVMSSNYNLRSKASAYYLEY
ncbi:MAG: diaminopimelate decarboxylase [Bacteroidia bacterium]|jgi:diaminopimelate decarboxylase|nr:diaminopimelate decarboxylase [Bacteroidia bacterium]